MAWCIQRKEGNEAPSNTSAATTKITHPNYPFRPGFGPVVAYHPVTEIDDASINPEANRAYWVSRC